MTSLTHLTFGEHPQANTGSPVGVHRPKMGLNGPSRGSGDPVGQPAPNGAPSGPPSSRQLVGGPWCCSFVFPWSFVWFGRSFGPWILVSASDLSEVSFYLDLGDELILVWPSNSCALIQCFEVYFYPFLSMVFLHMQTWSPKNSDSPKLVEMISIKVLIPVWCLFWYWSLQELMVNFST